jgi:hypothetical protein
MPITEEQRAAWNKQTAKDQAEWNKWLKVKEIIGPEATHTISHGLTIAAQQFRADQKVSEDAGVARIAEQFKAQADKCEKIAFWLEL